MLELRAEYLPVPAALRTATVAETAGIAEGDLRLLVGNELYRCPDVMVTTRAFLPFADAGSKATFVHATMTGKVFRSGSDGAASAREVAKRLSLAEVGVGEGEAIEPDDGEWQERIRQLRQRLAALSAEILARLGLRIDAPIALSWDAGPDVAGDHPFMAWVRSWVEGKTLRQVVVIRPDLVMATLADDRQARVFNSVFLHEIAHVIQGAVELRLGLDRHREDPHAGHGPDWVAACALLRLRANLSGLRLSPEALGAGYVRTLRLEPGAEDLDEFEGRLYRRLGRASLGRAGLLDLDAAADLVAAAIKAQAR